MVLKTSVIDRFVNEFELIGNRSADLWRDGNGR